VLDIPIETAHKRSYHIEQASHLSDAVRLNILIRRYAEMWVSSKIRINDLQTLIEGRLVREHRSRQQCEFCLSLPLAYEPDFDDVRVPTWRPASPLLQSQFPLLA
jgi:hypothetical protein